MEGEQAAAQQQQPVKRKRGRPRKSESAPTTPGTDTTTLKPKKQRKRKGDADAGPPPSSVDVTMIGQQVTGMLEGTFDAGYLLSVRVGTSDTILRGVVFGPGLSVPLTKVNDVAPGVKQVRREEKPIAKPAAAVPAKPPTPVAATSFSPFVVPPAGPSAPAAAIPPTSAVLESAAALFGNSIAAAASAGAPSTGLVAALQQLPGGGYTPDPATFAQAASFQPESVKSL